jgi:hypothetical protein
MRQGLEKKDLGGLGKAWAKSQETIAQLRDHRQDSEHES